MVRGNGGRKCALFATASVTPVIPGGFIRQRVGQGVADRARHTFLPYRDKPGVSYSKNTTGPCSLR